MDGANICAAQRVGEDVLREGEEERRIASLPYHTIQQTMMPFSWLVSLFLSFLFILATANIIWLSRFPLLLVARTVPGLLKIAHVQQGDYCGLTLPA